MFLTAHDDEDDADWWWFAHDIVHIQNQCFSIGFTHQTTLELREGEETVKECITYKTATSSACPWGWSLDQGLHQLVFFQRDHSQMGGVFQHHLGHQVSCYWPCLEFPSLFPDIPSKRSIVIFRPAVFWHPALSKLNCPPCNLWSPGLDTSSGQQPQENCRKETIEITDWSLH